MAVVSAAAASTAWWTADRSSTRRSGPSPAPQPSPVRPPTGRRPRSRGSSPAGTAPRAPRAPAPPGSRPPPPARARPGGARRTRRTRRVGRRCRARVRDPGGCRRGRGGGCRRGRRRAARQSVRASRFRCPRSRGSGSTRSTPSGSIARPGRSALPAASTARIRAPWVAPQANLPTRFPFASGEAYRNLRSCAPAGVFGFNSSTSARASRSNSFTDDRWALAARNASTTSTRRTHPPPPASPSTGISSSRIFSPRSRWARTATSTCPRSTSPAAYAAPMTFRSPVSGSSSCAVVESRRAVPWSIPRACCWNAIDACPARAFGTTSSRASIAAKVRNPAEATAPCRAVISRDSARNSPADNAACRTPTNTARPSRTTASAAAANSGTTSATASAGAAPASAASARSVPSASSGSCSSRPPSPMTQTLDPTTDKPTPAAVDQNQQFWS